MSSITGEGIYVDGKLVWKNPNRDGVINQSIHITGSEVWVNGICVHSTRSKKEVLCAALLCITSILFVLLY